MSVFVSIIVQALLLGIVVGLVVHFAATLLMRRRIESAPLLAAAISAALALVAGGMVAATRTGFMGSHTPACTGVTDPTDPAQRTAVLACGDSQLQFVEEPHGNGDIQFLDIADPVTGQAIPGGPLAAIFPEANIHRNRLDEIRAGRIVARVWVDPNSAGYPKLRLAPGINYVWIDGVNPPTGQVQAGVHGAGRTPPFGLHANAPGATAQRGLLRAVIIPADTAFPTAVLPVDYYDHSNEAGFHGHNQPLARWIYWPNDVGKWTDCAKEGCCSVVGDD